MHTSLSAPKTAIAVMGVNHGCADIALREKLSISKDQYPSLLTSVCENPAVEEAVVVSTCNRVDVIASVCQEHAAKDHVEKVIERISGVSRNRFSQQMYCYAGCDAVRHVFRVASGLDSLIIGEPQILGQVKHAYQVAKELGTTDALLNRLFHRSFGVAKAVRSSTGIGRHAVSVCFSVKEVTESIFESMSELGLLVIGTGDMAELCGKYLVNAGIEKVFIASKTLSRAATLADTLKGVALSTHQIETILSQADVVIGASTIGVGESPLVTMDMVERVRKMRRGKPQLFVDLGVPRNFDEQISSCSNTFLYNIDDFKKLIDRNLDKRREELMRAQVLVDEEVSKFSQWLELRNVEPLIRQVVVSSTDITEREVQKTLRRMRRLALSDTELQEVEAAIRDFGSSVVSKVLHQPMSTLKEHNEKDQHMSNYFSRLLIGKDSKNRS